MKNKKSIGTRFFKEGSQNQTILAKFWGNGKTFTAADLDKLQITSPGARLSELKEAGFDVRKVANHSEGVGRPTAEYRIMKRRLSAASA